MPLFKVKSPGNVNAFNEFMAEISNFDLIDTKSINAELFYIPEMDSVSLNFQNAGFVNSLFIPSLRTFFYMMLGQLSLILVHFVLYLLGKVFKKT